MPKKITESGLAVYDEFDDCYNHPVKVIKDLDKKRNALGVACKRHGEFVPMFLEVPQAKRLIAALQEFVDAYEEEE
ncbi:hypothetical protein [Bacillus phage BC-T25]|nr:hypothetical protein [Bacillus phage BC-T25]